VKAECNDCFADIVNIISLGDSIKIDREEIGWKGVEWIYLAKVKRQ
jgi:hypothetical protein